MSSISSRLQELGVELPQAAAPAAAYVPFRVEGKTVYISGQLPLLGGSLAKEGRVGEGVSLEEAQEIARTCALNVLAHLKSATEGDLDKVKSVLKLEILVAAPQSFTEPHLVANGASDLMLSVFGEEVGKHARVAYGVSVLPMNAPVEVAATFALK